MANLAEMIGVLKEARGWQSLGQSPHHVQYFVLNVKGGGCIESIPEATYEAEHPDWATAIREDYAKVVAAAEDAKKLHEAADVANSDAVQFIAKLSDKQKAKLMALLADEPEAAAPEAAPAAAV